MELALFSPSEKQTITDVLISYFTSDNNIQGCLLLHDKASPLQHGMQLMISMEHGIATVNVRITRRERNKT